MNDTEKQVSIGAILSDSWKYFTANFQMIAIIILIIYIPINIILGFVSLENMMNVEGDWQGFRSYLKIIQILEGLIGIIATIAIAFVVQAQINKEVISVSDALKKAFSKWGVVIGASILMGLYLFGLYLLLIVPGIIFSIYWIFTIYAVILLDKTGKEAMDYSKELIKGRWWTAFWCAVIFGIMSFIVAFGAGFVNGLILEMIPTTDKITLFIVHVFLDTDIDIALSFFSVVSAVFFLHFDNTKVGQTLPLESKIVEPIVEL